MQINSNPIMKPFILTRYLYIKDEVIYSLIISLLNKNIEALFWGYELYYSGFKEEIYDILFNIYIDFYASLNPCFEQYIIKKYDEKEDSNNIGLIIDNLLIRPNNMDIFMMRQICIHFEIDDNEIDNNEIIKILDSNDYLNITNYILKIPDNYENMLEIFKKVLDYFILKGLKLNKNTLLLQWKKTVKVFNKYSILLLSRIMHYYSLFNSLKMGKNVYIKNKEDSYKVYDLSYNDNKVYDLSYNDIKIYKILENACKYEIDSDNSISLFQLSRYQFDDLKEIYREKWLYYVSFSPLFKERIEKYQGIIDNEKKIVTFMDEDLEECFYNLYNLEPDEQKLITQNKSIKEIKKDMNWNIFYNKYHNFKNSIYNADTEYLEEMDKITYE